MISDDRPIELPEEDALGFASFAQAIADALRRHQADRGLVVAVYGKWGTGKSSLMNLIWHFLETDNTQNGQGIVQLRFNPWWFSGREDLVLRFMEELSSSFKRVNLGAAVKALASFGADVISEIPALKATGKAIAKRLEKSKSLDALKRDLATQLREAGRKFIVYVDDIDRLSGEEIKQIFALVKAVADLPNIIYVLAFDNALVAESLTQDESGPGSEYLEKIVQVPFELPTPDRQQVRALLSSKLDAIFKDDEDFDTVRWGNVFFDAIDPFVRTPRTAMRLANTLSVTYPAVKGEVNPIDFVAIEAFRVFVPNLYESIRTNPQLFAGTAPEGDRRTRDREGEQVDAMVKRVSEEDRATAKDGLIRLFPRLEAIWSNTYYTDVRRWRKELRVCSTDIFPVYFRFSAAGQSVSNEEIQSFLQSKDDVDAMAVILSEMARVRTSSGLSKAGALLDRVVDHASDIEQSYIGNLLRAVFRAGDTLIAMSHERHAFDLTDTSITSHWLVNALLERLDDMATRDAMMLQAFKEADGISLMLEYAMSFAHEHGEYTDEPARPEHDRRLSLGTVKELLRVCQSKLTELSESGEPLLRTPRLGRLLYDWERLAGIGVVRAWAQNAVQPDEELTIFIGQFASDVSSHTIGDAVSTSKKRVSTKSLEHFLPDVDFEGRARSILDGDDGISPEDREILEALLQSDDDD